MSGNNRNTQLGGLAQFITGLQQITQDFDRAASNAQMFNAQMQALSLEVRGPRSLSYAHLPLYTNVPPDIQNTVESQLARDKATCKEFAEAATAFARGLIQWAEQMKQGEAQRAGQADGRLETAPSTPVLSGKTGRIGEGTELIGVRKQDNGQIGHAPDEFHDNSQGRPAVLIYTNNKDTYDRYTTIQSKNGELKNAYVIYVGSPESPNNAGLAMDNPLTSSPDLESRTYNYRVTISPGESWFSGAAEAQFKEEEIAFNQISAATIPHLTGFSMAAGAVEEETATVAAKAVDVAEPAPVDAGIQWGKGIIKQGVPWEDFTETQLPLGTRLPPDFETFDFFNPKNGVATSNYALNTMTPARLQKPGQILSALKTKIDEAAEFTEASKKNVTLKAEQIKLRVVRVAIPSTTTEGQMEQINAAIRYGRDRNIIVIVIKAK